MSNEQYVRNVLRSTDPARDLVVSPPVPASVIVANTNAGAADTFRLPARAYSRRRLLLAGAAVTAAAAGVGTLSITRRAGLPEPIGGQPTPSGPAAGGPPVFSFPAVVRPMAVQYQQRPPSAADRLLALADRITPAPFETVTGRYTYLRIAGWNAVFDDAPGGNQQIIRPSQREVWFLPDGSGRQRLTMLPPVFPNEASRRYWQNKGTAVPNATPGTGGNGEPDVDELGPGTYGLREPLPSGPDELARRLMDHDPSAPDLFRTVHDVFWMDPPKRTVRAEILRLLARQRGVAWLGETTDRAGRPGVAIGTDAEDGQHILVLDAVTGMVLADETIEEPDPSPADATLFLDCTRTDHF